MAPDSNYYEVLGVASSAPQDEIRRAFRERVRACHPDRVANLDEDLRRLAEEKMVELNEAYAVLRNPARRAAYDDRHGASAAAGAPRPGTAPAPESAPQPAAPASPEGKPRPIRNPAEARNRIGEQEFVARAASEEFLSNTKRALANASWTPVALAGTTLAQRAAHGRSNSYFILLAAPRVDDKQLRRFLKKIEAWSAKLKPKLFGAERVYAFVAAVEFEDQQRLRRSIDGFNKRCGKGDVLQPATLIDLVNWHVAPGDVDLFTRLSSLIRGA